MKTKTKLKRKIENDWKRKWKNWLRLRVLRPYGVESMTNGGRYLGRSSTRLRQQVWYYLVVGKTKTITKTKKVMKTKTKLKRKNNWKTKTKTKNKNKSKRKSHCVWCPCTGLAANTQHSQIKTEHCVSLWRCLYTLKIIWCVIHLASDNYTLVTLIARDEY